ncbi:MAG: response regulator, partial [bacterium]|nr:response regulator [bacterium]
DSISSDVILSITEDSSGRLWFGTVGGLNRFDRGKGNFVIYERHPDNPEGLSHNAVRTIYPDRRGMLWVGTWGGGVNILDQEKAKFKYYQAVPGNPETLSRNLIFSVYQDSSGILWVGTWDAGLNRIDREKGTVTHYKNIPSDPHSLSNNTVGAIYPGRAGNLWIGTWGGGLNKFDPVKETFTVYKPIPGNSARQGIDSISALHEESSGILWMGTGRGGLNLFDPVKKTFHRYKHSPADPYSLSNDRLSSIYKDRSGVFWIGTVEGGLNRVEEGKMKFTRFQNIPGNSNSLSHNTVKSICEDRAGVLWIGTDGGGLNKFERDKNQWTNYTAQDGLPDNVIYGILEDAGGNLWLSTNKGISRFNPLEKTFKNYGVKDGIQADEFNTGAYYKNPRTGEMFFGGINGLNSFFPEHLKLNTFIPPVVITAFKKFNEPAALEENITGIKEIRVRQAENFISFEFAALNYRNPEKNQYVYMLENFDKEWIQCGTRRYANYTNLGGGTYVFRVIGSNNDGVWNETGASVTLIVLPSFWQTWWFRLLAVFFILACIYFIHRLRIRNIKARETKLEPLVKDRTKELETERRAAETASRFKSDFLARMSHEIRTPMNAIIGFNDMMLDTELTAEQLEYIRTSIRSGETLLGLINDILDFSKMESGQLLLEAIDFDPEVMAFDVCELMKPRIGDKHVEIICRIGPKVPSNLKGDPGRFRQVLTNLMVNAVKFTGKGEVELALDVDKENQSSILLHASVKDTGIGIPPGKLTTVFDAFQQADGSTTRKYGGSGLGLAICKQIAVLMDGDIRVESEPGKGSTFHFTAVMKKSTAKPVKRPASPPSLAGKRVLIVDDNLNNLEILKHLLDTAGMKVTALDNGTEVLPSLVTAKEKGDPFDLCVLDIRMPDLSGYEVAKQIRAPSSPHPDLPLLAFTSSYSKRVKAFQESGFDGFLPKPVQSRKLLDILEQLLEKRSIEREVRKQEPMVTRHSIVDEAKHSVRILLVEDNPVNQKLALYLLTKAGYHVETADNGKEAVDMYKAEPDNYDLIFMDIQMPKMNGFDATKEIRRLEDQQNPVPIIAMTAQAMKGEREKCLDAGMNDYIPKPIKREIVFEIVKKWAIDKKIIK